MMLLRMHRSLRTGGRPTGPLMICGALLLLGAARAAHAQPGEKGACCFPSGSCAVVTQGECGSGGGLFQGMGTVCAPGLCAQPAGACCFDTGGCIQATQAQCNAMGPGADWQGAFVPCMPGLCVPIKGACCFEGQLCAAVTAAECAEAGGTYQGDGTVCTPGLCTSPEQADLNDDGSVDIGDLLIVILDWGCNEPLLCHGDATQDGLCDADDLIAVVSNWGPVK